MEQSSLSDLNISNTLIWSICFRRLLSSHFARLCDAAECSALYLRPAQCCSALYFQWLVMSVCLYSCCLDATQPPRESTLLSSPLPYCFALLSFLLYYCNYYWLPMQLYVHITILTLSLSLSLSLSPSPLLCPALHLSTTRLQRPTHWLPRQRHSQCLQPYWPLPSWTLPPAPPLTPWP